MKWGGNMWSIIKSHFHRGKTGFIVTGLFVILSVLMMIVGLSICLGMGDLYVNTQKISNSPDATAISFGNYAVFDSFMVEMLDKYSNNVDKVNRHKALEYSSSSETHENYFEFRYKNGGNLTNSSFRVLNIDDKDNEYIPRIRDSVTGEGFKVYITGNAIETANLKVGMDTYFVYKGNRYKGYVAGVYDSMPMIYWTQNYFVDNEFYKLLEGFMQSDEDFQYDNMYNIRFKYKNEKECEKIINNFSNELRIKANDYNSLHAIDKDHTVSFGFADKFMFIDATKSFILVLGAALIAFSVLVALVTALVIAFLVRSSIMDEVRNLGVFKSLGYTTNMLRLSYLAIFGVISSICMLIGIVLGISLMPTFVNVITAMARLDCTKAIGFNVGSIFIAIAFIVLVISSVVMLATARIKRITPLSAMRNNFETHSFKKSLAPLSKSKLPVNGALGIKSIVGEHGRSIMVVVVVLIMSFLCAFTSVVFYNLKVDQTAIINMSAMEVPDWVIGFNYDDTEPYFNALRSMEGYQDDKLIFGTGANIDDDGYRTGIYYEDFDNLRTNLVYEGRLPKHKNEMMLEFSLAKEMGYKIGDTITLTYNFSEFIEVVKTKLVVVGFFQSITKSTNYVCFIDSVPDVEKYFGSFSRLARHWYFEKGKVPTDMEIVNHLQKTLKVDKISYMGFMEGRYKIERQFLNTVETAADAVMSVLISVTVIIIVMLLVVLIKLKLLREKRNYAIYKALGYTTTNVMTQIAVAMVILGIIGSLVGALVGGLLTTPLLSLAGGIIGVGRFAFVIPWGYIFALIFALPAITYLVSMLCAIPVRKIAPATLLRERG